MKQWQRLRSQPKLWPQFFIREQVITAIRRFFLDRDFHEVETPLLTGSLPPESYLEVFETTLYDRAGNKNRAYLPTSPEPFLKKLLVAGIGNCFTITKSFRNTETNSKTHNPEFTILEWYRTDADYRDIMADCEELIIFINTYLLRSQTKNRRKLNSNQLLYQGKLVDIATPWERISMAEAFKKYAGLNLNNLLGRDQMAKAAAAKGYKVEKADSWEKIFHLIFLNEIEPKIGLLKPTFLYDYPAKLAALSRRKHTDPRYAERFEFYINNLELGDAYSELTDWREQAHRFQEEQQERIRLGKTDHPVDLDFINALKTGMPPTGGIAVGVDRLIMLFANVTDIRDTMFFPATELFEDLKE